AREPRASNRPQAKRLFPAQTVGLVRQLRPAHRLPTHEPVHGKPRVVARDARAVGPRAHRNPAAEHFPDRRCGARGVRAIAGDEVLAGERHAILDGDAAAEGVDAIEALRRDGLGVIERPPDAGETAAPAGPLLPVDLLEYVEDVRDRFVVRRMDADRPALRDQLARDPREIVAPLRPVGQLGPRSEEVFEVARGPGQELAATLEHVTVRAEPVAVRARLVLRGPALEVLQLASGPLREEVVGDAE